LWNGILEYWDERNAGTLPILRSVLEKRGRVNVESGAFERDAAAVENAAEQVFRERHLHAAAEKADFVGRRDTSTTGEHLEMHSRPVDADDLGQRFAARRGDDSELTIRNAFSFDGNDVTGNVIDSIVDFELISVPGSKTLQLPAVHRRLRQ
jgi:histone H3/H4